MPRPRAVTPNKHLHTTLPADLAVRLDLLLYSEVEGCVPRGAYQEIITRLIRQFFEDKEVDISPFLDESPGQHVVRGSAHTLSKLLSKFSTTEGVLS